MYVSEALKKKNATEMRSCFFVCFVSELIYVCSYVNLYVIVQAQRHIHKESKTEGPMILTVEKEHILRAKQKDSKRGTYVEMCSGF